MPLVRRVAANSDLCVEQHTQRVFREGEARRAPAARPFAEMPLVGVEPAAEPIQLVVLADLVRALVQVAVQADLVAVFREQVDLRRIFLDDPARHEKGQPQLAARELLDQPRDRDQRVVRYVPRIGRVDCYALRRSEFGRSGTETDPNELHAVARS